MGQDAVETEKPIKSKRRRITRHDIKQIAGLVVRYRMNETEACLEAGISPKQWSLFKHRHKTSATFEELINGIRASNLRNCVDTINSHGGGIKYTALNKQGEVVELTKPGDWRAKAWIAERVLAPERLAQQQAAQQATQINVYAAIGLDLDAIGSKVYAERKSKAIDVGEVKQLPANTGDK